MVARPILLTKKSGAFACRELQTSTHRAAEQKHFFRVAWTMVCNLRPQGRSDHLSEVKCLGVMSADIFVPTAL